MNKRWVGNKSQQRDQQEKENCLCNLSVCLKKDFKKNKRKKLGGPFAQANPEFSSPTHHSEKFPGHSGFDTKPAASHNAAVVAQHITKGGNRPVFCRSVPALIAMLIAVAVLWFVTVIIPTAICRGIGHLSRLYERPQCNYDSWRDTCLDGDETEDEEDAERESVVSRSVPQVYYEDDKNFVFPRIKVK